MPSCKHALTLLYATLQPSVCSLWPRREAGSQTFLDPTMVSLSATFSVQSVEKILLQEGEKVVITYLGVGGGPSEQGVYGVVTSLGSIVVRTVFLSLEETAFSTFGKLKSSSNGNAEAKAKAAADNSKRSETNAATGAVTANAHTDMVVEKLLRVLVCFVTLIGLTFVAFGPSYSHLLLHLLYGDKWSSTTAPRALAW